MNFEKDYKNLVRAVLDNGAVRSTRNAATISTCFATLVIDTLKHGQFPLITGRKMHLAGILGEFAAFMHKPKTVDDFTSRGCNYWSTFADSDGKLNIDYGNKWLDWDGVNQLQNVIDTLKSNKHDRRMVVSGWDPTVIDDLTLPCCHMVYQFVVGPDGTLELIWYQRSADVMVGIPSDVTLAALMLIYVSKAGGLEPGNINMVFGDTHIYTSHIPSAYKYLESNTFTLPTYISTGNLFTFEPDDFKLVAYEHNRPIKFKLHE